MRENLILSECEEINSLLYQPIVTTQRIKYTCFDVSPNYVVLGSTSGSLYLFDREPCAFRQLIPLSEGPVSVSAISPDERCIAYATKHGSVRSISIKPAVKLLAISNEHLGETVTSLCWNDNGSEIYAGDGIGKISTVVFTVFTVNGMFQAPSCTLMHLDSTIVQMEFSGNLLLISTMTRCYVCDTTQEQFKQIGNKARDGEFGACFLTNKSIVDHETASRASMKKEGKRANGISDTNGDARTDGEEKTEIYCARPGCRLWEVARNGTVVKTHQFKEALAVPSSLVYRGNVAKFLKKRRIEQNWTPQRKSPNFSRLYALSGKYMFSHNRDSVYVIDPTNAAVILWNNEYVDITIARTISDRIYLMRECGTFHSLRLVTPDLLILDFYDKKNYIECLHACEALKPEYLKSTIGDNSSRFASDESENYSIGERYEIATILVPIVSLIRSNDNSQPVKLNSGIVVVSSGARKFQNDDKPDSALTIRDTEHLEERKKASDEDEEAASTISNQADSKIHENLATRRKYLENENVAGGSAQSSVALVASININDTIVPSKQTRGKNGGDARTSEKILSSSSEKYSNEIDKATLEIQMNLNPVYKLINDLRPSMRIDDMENIINNVRKTMNNINDNYGKIYPLKDFLYEILRSIERHYYNILLENTTNDLLLRVTDNEKIINEIVKAFVDANVSFIEKCKCGYRYPIPGAREPKFYEIGATLIEKFSADGKHENCIKLCNDVAFMWRHYLPMIVVKYTIKDDILRMCLRTRDSVVLSTILPMLDVRQWEIVVKCVANMRMGICPCCNRRNEHLSGRNEMEIDWSDVTRELVKREGTSSAMTFLILIDTVIPNVTLDKSIFQSLIFTKILDHRGIKHFVDFCKNDSANDRYGGICSPEVQEQLASTIEKDLERPMEKNAFGIGVHNWGMRIRASSLTCPSCTLSLNTPVLLGDNGISLFSCGHVYHVNCLIQRKLTKCNLH